MAGSQGLYPGVFDADGDLTHKTTHRTATGSTRDTGRRRDDLHTINATGTMEIDMTTTVKTKLRVSAIDAATAEATGKRVRPSADKDKAIAKLTTALRAAGIDHALETVLMCSKTENAVNAVASAKEEREWEQATATPTETTAAAEKPKASKSASGGTAKRIENPAREGTASHRIFAAAVAAGTAGITGPDLAAATGVRYASTRLTQVCRGANIPLAANREGGVTRYVVG